MASDKSRRGPKGPPADDARVYLWRAVIQQALIDATTPLAPSMAKVTRERLNQINTREWFTRPNRDFLEVCELAGVEPDRVRAKAIPLIEAVAKLDSAMPEPKRPRPNAPCHTGRLAQLHTFNGRSLTLTEWSKQTGISYGALYRRIYARHWSIERALSTKPRNTNPNRKRSADATINQAYRITA